MAIFNFDSIVELMEDSVDLIRLHAIVSTSETGVSDATPPLLKIAVNQDKPTSYRVHAIGQPFHLRDEKVNRHTTDIHTQKGLPVELSSHTEQYLKGEQER